MNIDCIYFDMDGVLLNSEILYQRFWLEALHYFNYPATESHILALRSLTGKKAEAKLKSFFGDDFDYPTVKAKRIELIRMIEKMERNSEFSERLGVRNKSELLPEKEHR